MLARGPQSPLGTLFMVWMNVGIFGVDPGRYCFCHCFAPSPIAPRSLSFVGGSSACSGGGASAALMSFKGTSKGVLVSIGVGLFGGRLVDFAIYFLHKYVYLPCALVRWRVRL